MPDDDVLAQVLRAAHGEEGYEVRTFVVYRRDGHELQVRLFDAGPGAGPMRYHAHAQVADNTADGPPPGNPAGTIQEALSNAHWPHED